MLAHGAAVLILIAKISLKLSCPLQKTIPSPCVMKDILLEYQARLTVNV
jgi:hypothetical protein